VLEGETASCSYAEEPVKMTGNEQVEELKQVIEKLQSELWYSLQLCETQKNDLEASEHRVKELEE
jgi:tRNA A58 N-methylase Trm61